MTISLCKSILAQLLAFFLTAVYSKPQCDATKIASPINIKAPMSSIPFEVDFKAQTLQTAQFIKIEQNHLKIEGMFGSLYYQTEEYRIYDLHFKYPSEHRINGERYALELQASAVSLGGAEFVVVVLFDRNDYMPLQELSNYGFGNRFVLDMPTFDEDPEKCRFELHGTLTLDDFLKNRKDFYLYEGSNLNGDCNTALTLVVAEPLWVSEEQLSIFKEASTPVYETKRDSYAIIYQNFIKPQNYNLHNMTSLKRDIPNGPTPGPYSHLPFLYAPEDGRPLGFLNKDFLPVWEGKSGGVTLIEPEFDPKRHGDIKFIKIGWRPFLMPGLKTPYYIAQYVMTSKNYRLPQRGAPIDIPVYMRAKYLTQGKYRPIVKLRMPILMEGKNNTKQDANSTLNMACKKWWLHVTLNRNFDHELMYKNISDEIGQMASIRKCANYAVIPNTGMTHNLSPANSSMNASEMAQLGGVCKTHLQVLLNRESDENLDDYIYQGCTALKRRGLLGKSDDNNNVAGAAQVSIQELGAMTLQRNKMKQQEVMGI